MAPIFIITGHKFEKFLVVDQMNMFPKRFLVVAVSIEPVDEALEFAPREHVVVAVERPLLGHGQFGNFDGGGDRMAR